MEKFDLQNLIAKLLKLGEDKDELDFWLSLYDDLDPAEQRELTANLEGELQKLERLSPVSHGQS